LYLFNWDLLLGTDLYLYFMHILMRELL